jgi:TRAP-type mannitol/chloroaromatic compound transport system permease small subunit
MTDRRIAARLARGLDTFIDVVGQITGWLSLALVLVMASNVLLRYGFRTGSVAMQELEWHLMAPLCLLGVSYALRHDGHVKVDVLYGQFPVRVQRFVDLVSMVLVTMIAALLAWLAIPYVEQSWRMGEGSPDPGGLSHRWILKAVIPVGFGLLFIQSVAAVFHSWIAFVDASSAENKRAV